MTKRITISSLIFALLLSLMPFGSFAQTEEVVEAPVIAPANSQFIMEVKWGQVEGPVTNSSKTLFDGSISANQGTVSLLEALLFEQHDNYRDQITNKQDPVAWRSWITTHYDGVKVRVNAPVYAKVTIDTAQGAVVLNAGQLARSLEPYKLQLPQGREIVISIQPVPQTYHFMKVYWGVLESEHNLPQPKFDLQESLADEVQLNVEVEYPIEILPVPESSDFGGILGVSGATLQFISPYLFEANQGDRITYQDRSTVAWDSTIYNRVDGVWMRTFFGADRPSNERFGIAFMGDAHFIKFYNMRELFNNRRTVETIYANGRPYRLVIEAFTIQTAELDEPLILPEPMPAPPVYIEDSQPQLFDLEPSAETEQIEIIDEPVLIAPAEEPQPVAEPEPLPLIKDEAVNVPKGSKIKPLER